MPPDLGLPQAFAICLIFGLWGFYSVILRTIGKGSLNSQLHVVRLQWLRMHGDIGRRYRMFDAILLGHISNSISFFGSATLLVLAGLVGALVNVNHIYETASELKFVDRMSSDLFTIYFAVLAFILGFSFFAFTYAMRKLSYTFALLGGLQDDTEDPVLSGVMVEQAAIVLTEAVRSINTGIRGFYYAIAALFLFAGPYWCIAATIAITGLLYYRQMFSVTARAIGKYVDALDELTHPRG
ncbi:DUF599 domain-containing protein [Aestuariivirga sp.]|uniref:DUF599 domain-containing protein n=1 Tax=Aestuariivirga sp. TaxID=2650926 RepID=UPI0039E41CD3